MTNKYKSILDMDSIEAKKFLLKETSFFTADLPPYFSFEKMISKIDKAIGSNDITFKVKAADYDSVNYDLYNNKDGKYSWRKLQIIHPVLYVDLVNKITKEDNWQTIIERFKTIQKNKKIKCVSIPKESTTKEKDVAETIRDWWKRIEQESLKKSLDYKLIMVTDINDCYGSIYTHSIAWALHTKVEA